jgi:hypothetical protein
VNARSIQVVPPNSLVLIMDPSIARVPESMGGSLISASGSCVAVGCRSEADGATEITVGIGSMVNPGGRPAFDGSITTPNQCLSVCTVLRAAILKVTVAGAETRVRVWVNDPNEPDRVIVGVD